MLRTVQRHWSVQTMLRFLTLVTTHCSLVLSWLQEHSYQLYYSYTLESRNISAKLLCSRSDIISNVRLLFNCW